MGDETENVLIAEVIVAYPIGFDQDLPPLRDQCGERVPGRGAEPAGIQAGIAENLPHRGIHAVFGTGRP